MILVIYMGYAGTFSFINFAFLILCSLAFFSFPVFNIFLFVIMLATNGLISTEYNLFGFLGINRIVSIFAILSLLRRPVPFYLRATTFQRIAIYFVILLFFMIILRTLKEVEYGLSRDVVTYSEFFKRLAKYMLLSTTLILLITRYPYPDIRKAIIGGMAISVVFVATSIWLSLPLNEIGFSTNLGEMKSEDIIMAKRNAGFFMTEGDANTAGGYFALVLGLILSLRKSREQKVNILIIIIFAVFGILGTLSRAASIAIAGVILIYLLQEKLLSLKSIGIILGLGVLLIILYINGYFDLLITRFTAIEETMSRSEDTRLGGWILYLRYIFSDIRVLLIGATENVYTATMVRSAGFFRVAHNLYISNFYFFGFLGAVIPIALILRYMFRFRRATNSRLIIWYTLFPFLMITMTTSDIGILFPFILSIPFTPYLIPPPVEVQQARAA